VNAVHELGDDLVKLARAFDGSAKRTILDAIGEAGQDEVAPAVRGDIGDTSMSGWSHLKPVQITGRYRVLDDDSVVIMPTPQSAGPMTVLDRGREAYAAGARRKSGTRTVKATSERVDKFRTVKRRVGATRGKGTWQDAIKRIDRVIPAAVDKAVAAVVKGILR